MCRIVFFCVFAIFSSPVLLAQYPSLHSYTVSELSSVVFKCDGAFEGTNHAEVPPWIIAGGWRSYFFVDGVGTYIWSNPTSLATANEINLNIAGSPFKASMSYISSNDFDPGRRVENWKR